MRLGIIERLKIFILFPIQGIVADVLPNVEQIPFITNDVFIIIPLPERNARHFSHLINFPG